MFSKPSKRILAFDIENRPLTYYAPDYPTAEITAIASMWIGDPDSMHVCLLGEEEPAEIIEHWLDRFVEADMLSGHNIRKHDLPIINASMIELGYEPMGPILTSDTLADLRKYRTLPRSQEHLAEMLEVRVKKVHMTQQDWREANRLTPAGLAKTRKRVELDVKGHIQIRKTLMERGWLKQGRVWRP